MKPILKFSLCLALIVVTSFISCRKTDFSSLSNDKKVAEEFFTLPTNVEPEITKLAQDLKKQDSVLHFLPSFIRKNGTPRWDKVLYKVDDNAAAIGTGARLSNVNSNKKGVFFIPMQSTTSKDIQSYITAYKHSDSLYTYRLYHKDTLDAI